MKFFSFILLGLVVTPAYAANEPTSVFGSAIIDMTYPSTSGNYMVYSQRVGQTHQIMRVDLSKPNAPAVDVSIKQSQEVLRNGVALQNGDIAFVSNRLGYMTPWLFHNNLETALHPSLFVGSVIPNHLTISSDAQTIVFDSSLEISRSSRISTQFGNAKLNSELLGQNWRMYHDNLWQVKSGYATTESGLKNTFEQAQLFTYKRNNSDLTLLGDGFDASLSPDARWMVFVREDNGNFDLWKQNLDGTGLKRLTDSPYADIEPSLSSDGKYVAFVSNHDSGGEVLETSIYTLEVATGKITRLTFGKHITDGGPTWLDNKTIIFHSNRDPNNPSAQTTEHWGLWQIGVTQ